MKAAPRLATVGKKKKKKKKKKIATGRCKSAEQFLSFLVFRRLCKLDNERERERERERVRKSCSSLSSKSSCFLASNVGEVFEGVCAQWFVSLHEVVHHHHHHPVWWRRS